MSKTSQIDSEKPTRKSSSTLLSKAKMGKNDEFYTQLSDIERELWNYREHFRDKTIFCNCDDPEESNFWRYFSENFEFLWLKKLIATHFETDQPSYKLEIIWDINGDGKINKLDTIRTPLSQNGDFRSPECIEIMKEADIVVTNPPFSLFREYVTQLFEYEKKFLIIGNINCITYKEIFKLIQENRAWLGLNMGRGISGFIVPTHYELYGTEARIDEKWNRIVSTNNCLWLTNLDNNKRHEGILLYKQYSPEEYPKYDNYNAIEVSKTKDIPMDYMGAMGVPITFLDKYNPEQFEILGCSYSYGEPKGYHITGKDFSVSINGEQIYKRLFIKNKKLNP